MKLSHRSLSASNGSSTIRLEMFMIFTQLDGGCRTSGSTSTEAVQWLFAILFMKMLVNVMENNFRNGAIGWQIPKHVKPVSRFFVLGLIVNEILTFEIFDHGSSGQCHYV